MESAMLPATQYFPALDEVRIMETVNAWKTAFPQMGVLALLPESEKAGVSLLQRIFSGLAAPLVGGIFPELIAGGAFRKSGVWLLRIDEAPFYLIRENLPRDAAGAALAAVQLSEQLRPRIESAGGEATLFLLFDAMVPNIATLLDELYLKLGNCVHYAGANAGSETFKPMPCLFDAERIVGDAMLAVLVKNHTGAILEHGYKLPEQSHTATSTDGNRITSIDWRPAFEIYREFVRTQYGIEITRDNFYQYAVHFPFGIVRADHSVLVRIPVALGEDGSLFCVGEVPSNSVLTLLRAPEPYTCGTAESLADRLSQVDGGTSGRDLLLFYCAGRRLHFGVPDAETEILELHRRSGVRQIAGALSLGEIGATTQWGYPLFHNATLVTAIW